MDLKQHELLYAKRVYKNRYGSDPKEHELTVFMEEFGLLDFFERQRNSPKELPSAYLWRSLIPGLIDEDILVLKVNQNGMSIDERIKSDEDILLLNQNEIEELIKSSEEIIAEVDDFLDFVADIRMDNAEADSKSLIKEARKLAESKSDDLTKEDIQKAKRLSRKLFDACMNKVLATGLVRTKKEARELTKRMLTRI